MKIKSMEIQNFKLFDTNFDSLQNVEEANLVLFNGPNGYGKTSIFDAIELALTGKIKRILEYSEKLGVAKNESCDSKILIADEKKEAFIKLVLEENGCEIELQRVYVPPLIKESNAENNPYKIFEKFRRRVFVEGKEILDFEAQEKFLEKYYIKDIEEFFDKCCFLSQDEHLQFIKEARSKKATGMDFLFKMPYKQQDELDKINKIILSLKNSNRKKDLGYITILENSRKKLENEINELKEPIEKIAEFKEEGVEYIQIFPEKSIQWDKEIPLLNEEEFEDAIEEIEQLMYFSQHKEECLKFIFNKPLQDLLSTFNGNEAINCADNTLEYAYRYYALLKNEQRIEKQYNLQQQFAEIKKYIENRKIYNINWETIKTEKLLDEQSISNIEEEIRQIENLKKSQGIVSVAISSITEARVSLMNYVNEAMERSVIEKDRCPLCDAPYENREILEQKILEKEIKLQSLCDETAKEVKMRIDDLYVKYLDNLLIILGDKLKNVVSEEIYVKLQEVKENRSKIYEIKEVLQKIDLSLPEEYQEDIIKISEGYEKLSLNIKVHLKEVQQEIEERLITNDFWYKYGKYYDKQEENFLKVETYLLQIKKKYIKNVFYNLSMKLINKKIEELNKIDERLKKLNKIYKELYKYKEAIEKGVQAYKKEVICDIEPLLYVYTAKILQQKFNGRSIFISTDKDVKKIELINSGADNHDILYNMSSGQLAAVALAFLLCMNQVYAQQQYLPILLIDDPIQTIDDVNMVGLVDILRFEFDNTQIFMSTHEQKFEWYLKYKYERVGKKIESFNMKNILLQVSE